MSKSDLRGINNTINQFFSIFNNKNGAKPPGGLIHSLLLPTAVITHLSGKAINTYNIDEFIKPRIKILSDGSLTDFSEWQTETNTISFGHIAQHQCTFEKRGILNNEPYQGSGTKLFQLVKVGMHWKVTALMWQE